ncbi:MAG: hypothetical protein EAZ39_22905 [Oscillatoriales cyanobacterium]|uniref:hypothetical protein n=1 Tax=Microcoleus sp. PH2017_05_CCC_O_A TaxID=2798816 RepID=UPI001D7CFBAF|nr:hypothetical protein [Microcoleus sp. PH2017_05_CCC_O_A]TAF96163.1 MAG: hypothetical protein EAZ45_24280 [Oscillatoriales cyanobacterium]MCC3437086.1 hypothetical protein [Microcoleus sp. PH2017_05_CCC_O_A]TAG14961.1 MAG: hypothetical protein EAZ39_22905 [Oscillatoriales cyanobacterium]TAG48201.1 MAG: hypothetical protein EAZ33_03565 [Oscillatoriales cyanobacterium]TAG58844.1 MAG: hypothetical protein EAZ28_13655 [Oscillatoriales cyanobacterium]
MKDSSNFSPAERVESLKAGSVAAFSCLLAFGSIALVNTLILAQRWDALAGLQVREFDLNFGLRGLMALLGGFLFGVTYRYAIRRDTNRQLKSGVVLAFGLVRAFGQLDAELSFEAGKMPGLQELLPFAVVGVESVVLFAIAGLVLDWAIVFEGFANGRSLIKPFDS